MIYHTKWSILVQKTAALLMPDFGAKNTATSVVLEKLLHLFFFLNEKGKKLFQEDDGRDAFFFLAT